MVIKSLIQFLLLSVCMTSLNAQDVVPTRTSAPALVNSRTSSKALYIETDAVTASPIRLFFRRLL